jgi:hypothetical protein
MLENQPFLNYSNKRIFLVDGIGALVTAVLLSMVLMPFESFFGMPKSILFVLATMAFVFALYSILCFLFLQRNLKFFLKIILFANLTYCFISIGLVFYFFESLTHFGIAYFLGEILIIAVLIYFENKKIRSTKGTSIHN